MRVVARCQALSSSGYRKVKEGRWENRLSGYREGLWTRERAGQKSLRNFMSIKFLEETEKSPKFYTRLYTFFMSIKGRKKLKRGKYKVAEFRKFITLEKTLERGFCG